MSFDFLKTAIERGHYEPESIYLSAPFEGRRRVVQLWGENPGLYQQIQIGGVPLRGHNGVDFGLPDHTRLLATDKGRVIEIGHDPGGYGRYLKIQHFWGESLYAHVLGFAVEAGQIVTRGQHIGFNDTKVSTQPHLHFAIRVYPYIRGNGWGGYSDPLPLLDPSRILVPSTTER